jgi:hypothetical protein
VPNIPEAILCYVSSSLLLVRTAGGAQKHFGAQSKISVGPRRRDHLCGEGEPQRAQCKHHQHVNVSLRALGMRAVIPSFRSSRLYLRQTHRSATTLCLWRLSTSPARHVFQRSLRRPMSHTQHRHYHSQPEAPTIYALSTASGKAAIAVIRVSGPACRQV